MGLVKLSPFVFLLTQLFCLLIFYESGQNGRLIANGHILLKVLVFLKVLSRISFVFFKKNLAALEFFLILIDTNHSGQGGYAR